MVTSVLDGGFQYPYLRLLCFRKCFHIRMFFSMPNKYSHPILISIIPLTGPKFQFDSQRYLSIPTGPH